MNSSSLYDDIIWTHLLASLSSRLSSSSMADCRLLLGARCSCFCFRLIMRSAPQRPATSQQAEAWQLDLPPLLLPVHLSRCLSNLYSLSYLPEQSISSVHFRYFHFEFGWCRVVGMPVIYVVLYCGFWLLTPHTSLGQSL